MAGYTNTCVSTYMAFQSVMTMGIMTIKDVYWTKFSAVDHMTNQRSCHMLPLMNADILVLGRIIEAMLAINGNLIRLKR